MMRQRKELKVRVSEELKKEIDNFVENKRTTLQMFLEDLIVEKLDKEKNS